MKNIVIVGAGGLAREIACLIKDINGSGGEWNFLGFVDSDPASIGMPCGAHSIIGDDSWLRDYTSPLSVVIAIGSPRRIDAIRQWLKQNP